MNKVKLSRNWNNKLWCNSFTLLLSPDPMYKIGAWLEVMVGKAFYCSAQIISIKDVKLRDIDEWTAHLDRGQGPEYLQEKSSGDTDLMLLLCRKKYPDGDA